MHVLTLSPGKAVEAACRTLLNHGHETSPRGQRTLEVLNATLEVAEPWRIPFRLEARGLNQRIGMAEAAQLIGQVSDPELMTGISAVFQRYQDGGRFHGAYGPRIAGGLHRVVTLLEQDPDSRQAVLSVYYQHQDLGSGARDIPCTLTLQFLLRGGELRLRTSMRSNDAWLGLPYDLVQFCALQGAVAAALDVPMGPYTHTVGSLHLYEQHWDGARDLSSPDAGSVPYEPLFAPLPMSAISRFCRDAIKGQAVPATRFEAHLVDWLKR